MYGYLISRNILNNFIFKRITLKIRRKLYLNKIHVITYRSNNKMILIKANEIKGI